MQKSLSLAAIAGALLLADPLPAAERPSLVVLIVIDQFPESLLTRFEGRFTAGGFTRLMDQGAWYDEAYFTHAATLTGVGHATIATGALSAAHGIPGNDWYDRERDRPVYCVEDAEHHWVGGKEKPADGTSPRNLSTFTFGDEWRLARGMRPRVISISLKDRGSILLGGKLGKAFWYDETTGLIVSSTYYYPRGALPTWVEAFNASRPADRLFGQSWELLLPRESYASAPDDRPYEIDLKGLGRTFPHVLGAGLPAPGTDFYRVLVTVPQGNEMILDLARRAITAEELGKRDEPDVLCLSLTANDYCGHTFGPESLEYEDITLRTDRQLEAFLDDLDRLVGAGRSLILLTSDHGATPSPEHVAEVALPVGRIDPDAIAKAADEALDGAFGRGDWAARFLNPGLFLRAEPMRAHKTAPADAERVAAEALRRMPGIAAVFTRSDVASNRLPATAIARSVAASFHPERSPDVFILQDPYWYLYKDLKKYEGMHGSPYAYDAHVPVIVYGPGVSRGRWSRRVSPADIAPTVCHILGIQPPASSEGTVLTEALPPPRAPRRLEAYAIPALPPLVDESGTLVLVPVTVDWLGGPPLAAPRLVPAREGGFSALSRVQSAGGGGWEPFDLWSVTDRGPNLVIDKRLEATGKPFGKDSKFFPLPGYVQSIQRMRLLPDRTLRIVETIPLRRKGAPLSGLPSNDPARPSGETAYRGIREKTQAMVIPPSPSGYDIEGLVEVEPGDGKRRFWACEEYGPSLLVFDGEGNLIRELVPGAARSGEGTPASPAVEPLPAVLRHRRPNRGFEGLAGDRRFIYAMVQSPLDAAGGSSGQPGHGNAATRLHRIVRVERATGSVAMLGYDGVPDPAAYGTTRDEVKIGDIAVIPGREGELLVHEYAARSYRHVHRIAITAESTILAEAEGVAYEAGKAPYVPVVKTLVLDLTRDLGGMQVPGKLEGLAFLDGKTLALGFDNDYGFEGDDAEIAEMEGLRSRTLVVTLEVELPPAVRPAAALPRAGAPAAGGSGPR